MRLWKMQNEELYEDLDFNKPTFEFNPKGNHEWRQQGPYIICKSCELEHASWIGMERILIGINEKGQPILKRR
jgi:hypothetical protein